MSGLNPQLTPSPISIGKLRAWACATMHCLSTSPAEPVSSKLQLHNWQARARLHLAQCKLCLRCARILLFTGQPNSVVLQACKARPQPAWPHLELSELCARLVTWLRYLTPIPPNPQPVRDHACHDLLDVTLPEVSRVVLNENRVKCSKGNPHTYAHRDVSRAWLAKLMTKDCWDQDWGMSLQKPQQCEVQLPIFNLIMLH